MSGVLILPSFDAGLPLNGGGPRVSKRVGRALFSRILAEISSRQHASIGPQDCIDSTLMFKFNFVILSRGLDSRIKVVSRLSRKDEQVATSSQLGDSCASRKTSSTLQR